MSAFEKELAQIKREMCLLMSRRDHGQSVCAQVTALETRLLLATANQVFALTKRIERLEVQKGENDAR